MENVQCASIARTSLEYLGIRYRAALLPRGCLCFCTLTGGLTFNLFMGSDGQVRLWRFVGTATMNSAGTGVAFRRGDTLPVAVGFEVTEEGDIRLYARQLLPDSEANENRMVRIIRAFCDLLSDLNVCLFPPGPGGTPGGEDG